ncbi:RpiB/LacA/LacB family sugar-phosphate isomerase [Candidatus Daviesbacteria bacterium]|nr:RpiB/LacA/LacB family sugar-phosphate isomerase [Candidatus Daviesbacteria bacterium]
MVYLGSDHGGYQFKEEIKLWLMENNIAGEDLGADSFQAEDDYPDFIIPVAQKVASDSDSLGIILGRSGNGEAIAANKVKGVRAALCLNEEMARKARQHNNANIISLGADYISVDMAKKIIKVFLETPFSNGERHIRRIEKITNFEKSQ